jgi:hypothetical protein
MKKIISLFQRNYDGDRLVRNEVVPGAEWVINGEGVATRKYDGTCCMIRDDKLYRRYDAKQGKTPPPDFIPAQEPDPVTGHWPGWVPVGDEPQDRWHKEAFNNRNSDGLLTPGTYELCGPKIQANPENLDQHVLIKHGDEVLLDCPRDFDGIREYLKDKTIEGDSLASP